MGELPERLTQAQVRSDDAEVVAIHGRYAELEALVEGAGEEATAGSP